MGALARWGAASWWPSRWVTVAINVVGCLALGWVLTRWERVDWVRAFVAVGFLGAFTTMSVFAVDAMELVDEAGAGAAALYVVASVGGGLGAFWFGRRLG